MKKITFIMLLMLPFFFTNFAFADDYEAYEIFEKDGDETDFEDIIEEALEADIIFFGEQHNNPICHWLQLELTKAVYEEKKDKLVLGAEMFEADDQFKIDEYFAGFTSTKSFEKECRIWKNYKTDYKPLVEFAKKNGLKFIATNVPRRYASTVSKRGFKVLDSMSNEAKQFLPTLPIKADMELPGYKKMAGMMGGGSHGIKFIAEAQALKDATMGHFILKNYANGKTFIHFNGAYHSENFEGIVWYIKQHDPNIKILTISNTQQDEIEDLEEKNINTADFIIVTPKEMTKTY